MNVLVERYLHLTLNKIVEKSRLVRTLPERHSDNTLEKCISQNGKNKVDIIAGKTDNMPSFSGIDASGRALFHHTERIQPPFS